MVKLSQEDVQRRKKINEDVNPRVTIYNEATQLTNPVDGRIYPENDAAMRGELNHLINNPHIPISTFMEYQLSLARMDVRDNKMPLYGYHFVRKAVDKLATTLRDSKIPLQAISDANGFDYALCGMESEMHNNANPKLIIYSGRPRDKLLESYRKTEIGYLTNRKPD